MRAAVGALLLMAAPADAAVRESGPDGFLIVHEGVAPRPPADTWAALTDWGGWWPAAHSYSGKAENFDLDVEADGGLEEEWEGGAVLHGSVLHAQPGKLLRLSAPLGPLQALPVVGILDVTLAPADGGTRVVLSYRVGGPASAKLDGLAAPVDAVMGEAFARLLAHRPPAPDKARGRD
jgi:uncharacterized protein YndB with AHSA1/START domain